MTEENHCVIHCIMIHSGLSWAITVTEQQFLNLSQFFYMFWYNIYIRLYIYIYIYIYPSIAVLSLLHSCKVPRSSVQFSCSVMPYSLRPHGLQHTSLPCPSPTPRTCSNSCPLNRWCHPTISSSVICFSSCLQSFPASGSFQMNQFFASGGQSIGASQFQHQSFQWIFKTDFL